MKTIYFVRHGETDHNATGLTMGQLDIPLNERGREQAAQTATYLQQFPITRIVSSDLSRAIATAAPLGKALSLAVELNALLRELCFGVCEGRRIADYEKENPDAVGRWRSGDFDYALPGAESRRELMERAARVLSLLLDSEEKHIAVFSHGGTLAALHTHLVNDGNPAPRDGISRVFRFHNTSISTAAHADNQWRFLVVNSTSHLSEKLGPPSL